MIRLATVFSGIGSIEWALKRLNIEHEIVFACDNGEIDIQNINEEEVRNTIKGMNTIEEQNEYIQQLLKSNKKTNFVKSTYLANYNIDESQFLHDVRFIDGTKYKDKVDLFVGGSPCQSFSIMGYQKGFEDTRGTLFYDYARLVSEIQPKVFIFENVQGLLKHDKGNTWEVIRTTFEKLGYDLHIKVLDAKDYGIPQTRRRLFVIGFRNGKKDFEFPEVKDLKFTLQDFLETTTKFGNFESVDGEIQLKKEPGEILDKYFLSEAVKNHVMSPGSKNYYTKPEIDLKIARPLLCTMHKMHRAGVDNYVTYKNKIRKLTPRECLRLMGYDDTFKIVVSDLQTYRQAGNSIVVDVLANILKQILKVENFE
ncbi:MAG: DNA cytosine methyltransferase [Clostridia bacterium]|nr:DNA cytosine methyltransferase [Clostridia bacterium]